MKTSHLQNASESNRIEELSAAIRHLWSSDLQASGSERERLVVELTDARLTLERLSFRAAAGQFRRRDRLDLSHCRQRVEQLRADWHQAPDLVAC